MNILKANIWTFQRKRVDLYALSLVWQYALKRMVAGFASFIEMKFCYRSVFTKCNFIDHLHLELLLFYFLFPLYQPFIVL